MIDFDVNGLTVDGTNYHVRVVFKSLKRSFSITEGPNSGKAINARAIRDVLGTQYTYSMNVEPLSTGLSDQEEYDRFYQVITAPVDYHTVEMPYGQTTIVFDAQIISGEDEYLGKRNGHDWWGGLTVSFVPMQPQRA